MENSRPETTTVLVYERQDPRDLSLKWLADQGIRVKFSTRWNEHSFKRYLEEQLIEDAMDCDGVLGSSGASISRSVIEALPRLKFISKLGIGTDSIDLAAATERGILVTNTPDPGAAVAVAEHAIALMLALAKRLDFWTPAYIRNGGWRGAETSVSMDSATVGIVGFGRIGQAVAQRLSTWNVRVLAYDPYVTSTSEQAGMVDLATLLRESDFITLHCAATPENQHIINGRALSQMKPTAYVVNTGRGMLIESQALVEALQRKALAGAALDVFESEPPSRDDALLAMSNVLLTPHVASRSLKAFLDSRWRAAKNMHAMAYGLPLDDLVNRQAHSDREKK